MLLSRIENPFTGEVTKKFNVTIPPNRYKEIHDLIETNSEVAVRQFSYYKNTKTVSDHKF
jgi:hypothetical protein